FDDHIPKELERICLKALRRRASERYTTAKDLADELRLFLANPGEESTHLKKPDVSLPPISVPSGPTSALTPPRQPDAPKIVPKGLRPFDAHDSDFFLALLPGPLDREGLPESIRFWKNRIEAKKAEETFCVGVIYGPSGCGKSSLVKAGLLP